MPATTGQVTAPATGPLHERCLEAIALLLKGLNLKGSSQSGNIGDNVYAKALADDFSDVQYPAIIVTTEGPEEPLDQETFEGRTWGYPCAVLVVDSNSPIDPNMRPDFLSWRHDAYQLLDDYPAKASVFGLTGTLLTNVTECWNLVLRPRSVFEEWQRQGTSTLPGFLLIASSFVVVCCCSEARQR